jgi:uncharacterized protein (TIGR03382 family)
MQQGDETPWELSYFTTGSDEDVTPPPPTSIVTVEGGLQEDPEWGPSTWLTVETQQDDDASHYVIEVTQPSGAVSQVVSGSNFVGFGSGLCLLRGPDVAGGEVLSLRSRSVDLAGNTSNWSPSQQHKVSSALGAKFGCQTVSTPSLATGALMGLMALVGRRRTAFTS